MMTSAAVAFFTGYLFLASTTTGVEPRARDDGVSVASTPMGYTEFCGGAPDCGPWDFLQRRALLEPKSADDPSPLRMITEGWSEDHGVTAWAAPDGGIDEPRPVERVLHPMLIKERWFGQRSLTAVAMIPVAAPRRWLMSHKERWFKERTSVPVAVSLPIRSPTHHIITASISPTARTTETPRPLRPVFLPMLIKERWFMDRPFTAVAALPAARPSPVSSALRSMVNKERWFMDRPLTAVAALPAARPSSISSALRSMVNKERWFRSRVFTASGPRPSPRYAEGKVLPKGGGRRHLGKPYRVGARWFTPREEPGYDVTGTASWYGSAFHRRMTSNGEWFDMDHLTAAHPTLPLPSYVKITNADSGSAIIVRVNDRGPFSGNRIIDVSMKCAEALGFKKRGTVSVRVQYLGAAPLDDGGSHLRAVNRELRRGTALGHVLAAADAAVRTLAAVDAKPRRAF